jgi:uncharacterized protein
VTTFSDVIAFRGHPMVTALHPRTIEVTTEDHLTVNGDCIIGVGADKGVAGLLSPVRDALRADGSRVKMTLEVGDESFSLSARGNSALPLQSDLDLVIRKSDFICGRTLAIGADAACKDIPRGIVEKLRSPTGTGLLRIEVRT